MVERVEEGGMEVEGGGGGSVVTPASGLKRSEGGGGGSCLIINATFLPASSCCSLVSGVGAGCGRGSGRQLSMLTHHH